MAESRQYRKLMAKIAEYREKQRKWLLEGGPQDYAQYREEVGAERMRAIIEQMMEEVEKEDREP